MKSPQSRILATVALLFSLLPLSTSAKAQPGPSFDCHQAKTRIERTICSNPELSQLDLSLSDLYNRARSSSSNENSNQLRTSQREWLQARAGICVAPKDWAALFSKPPVKDPADCLSKLYKRRIGELKEGDSAKPLTYWLAESKTAYSITGDLLLSDAGMILTGAESINLSHVRDIQQNHAMDAGFEAAEQLSLFKVTNGKPWRLISGNSLCGSNEAPEPPTYFVIAYSKHQTEMNMAVFDGAGEPVWEKSNLDNTTNLCGTYGYTSGSLHAAR